MLEAGESSSGQVGLLADAFLQEMKRIKSELDELRQHPWGEVQLIPAACDRIEKFCKALSFLLQARDGDVSDYLFFKEYNGKGIFERAVRRSFGIENGYYTLLGQECIKTAASTKTLSPKLAALQKIVHGDGHLDLEELVFASSILPELRHGMRKGSLKDEERSFFAKLKSMAEEITATAATSQPLFSAAAIKAVMKALQLFQAVPGAMDLERDIQKFMTINQGALASKDLEDYLKKNIMKERTVEAGQLLDLVKQCDRTTVGQGLLSDMDEMLLEILHIVSGQVRGGNLDATAVNKINQSALSLAQLKYVSDDYPLMLVKSFGNVPKLGVSWMSLSKKYESTGESCKVRVGKDPEDKMLVRLSSCITSFLGACASLDKLQENPGSDYIVNVLTGLSASQVFPESEASEAYAIFFDSIGLRASSLEQHLMRCGENAEKLVGGHHQGSDNFWRKDLEEDASFSDLKSAAKTSLKKLDGTQLKTAVEQLHEALVTAEKYMKQFGEVLGVAQVQTAGQGAKKGEEILQATMVKWKNPLRAFAAVLVEQLIMKAAGLPADDKSKLCSKMEQWVAGGMFGLAESDLHPTLLKIIRDA